MEQIEKTDYDKLNEYLQKVIDIKVSVRRKIAELGKVVDSFKNGEKYEEIVELDDLDCAEIVDYLKNKYDTTKILDEFDKDDLMDHIVDDYFIAADEYAAVKILKDSGNIDIPFEDASTNLPDFRKECSLQLIQDIVDKEGWVYLYSLLEDQKNKLNIV